MSLSHESTTPTTPASHAFQGAAPNASPRAPKEVFALTERDGKTFWTKIGAAFTNRDGSINLHLDAMPVSGKAQIREPLPREAREPRTLAAPPPGGPAVDRTIPF